jgi:tetratricopeptide (TPR) repeat protein
MCGRVAEAEAMLNEAIQTAEVLRDRVTQWNAVMARAVLRSETESSSSWGDLLLLADQAIPVFEEFGDIRGLARAWHDKGNAFKSQGQLARAAEAAQRGLEAARRGHWDIKEGELLGLLGEATVRGSTPIAEASATCERCRARMQAIDDRKSEGLFLPHVALLRAMEGNFPLARELLDLSYAVLGPLATRKEEAEAQAAAGRIEHLAGKHDVAVGHFRASLSDRGASDAAVDAASLARCLGELRLFEEMDRMAMEAEAWAAQDDPLAQALWRNARARALAAEGSTVRAIGLAREAVDILDPTDLLMERAEARMDLSEMLRMAGRGQEAIETAMEALALYTKKGSTICVERSNATIATLTTEFGGSLRTIRGKRA